MSGIVKPSAQKPSTRKTKAYKPPAGKLTAGVCVDCERDVLWGWHGPAPLRLEPSLTTTAAEATLWTLGVPTYEVVRGDAVSLVLRIPSPAPTVVEEVAIAHLCDAGQLWMRHTLRCPQWFGYSPYVVAQDGPDFYVLAGDEIQMVYKEVLKCSSPEAAHNACQSLTWRRRARDLR